MLKNGPMIITRLYSLRRIRDAFKENKDVEEPQEIQRQLLKAEKNLGVLKRQVRISEVVFCKVYANLTFESFR